MSTKTVQDDKIRARFSHMGLVVKDIEMMEDFYTNTIGFERTDGGMTTQGFIIRFFWWRAGPTSCRQRRRPIDSSPRLPPGITERPAQNVQAHLRRIRRQDLHRHHGNCWTMYTTDPEGNGIEFFVDTPWYVTQPFLKPMDFNMDEETLIEATEALVSVAPGFTTLQDFYKDLRERVPARESVLT